MLEYMIAFTGLVLVTAIHIHIRDMEAEEENDAGRTEKGI